MNLNIENWKEFIVGDLFDVSLSAGDLKIDDCDKGNIPLISSGQSNNGIVGYINEEGDEKALKFAKNKITVDMFCNAFYQYQDFFCVSHGRVNILTPKFKMNTSIGLFVATIINRENFKYSYGRAVYSNEIARMIIRLPADSQGNPDWEFMEKYIKSINHKPITTKNNRGQSSPILGQTNWKEYRLNDLFDIKAGIYHYSDEYEEGKTPYISASNVNNGIAQRISLQAEFKGNCIVTGKVGCTAFYQSEDFCATSDVNIFIPKTFTLNKYIGLFLVSVINKSENYKWSYGRQCRVGDSQQIIIKLPTKDGKPDWDFMEKYIKSLPYGDRI